MAWHDMTWHDVVVGGAQLSQIVFRIFRDFCVSLGVFVQDLFFLGRKTHASHMWWIGGDGLMIVVDWEKVGHQKRRSSNKWMKQMISSFQKKTRLEPFEFHFSIFIPKVVCFLLKGISFFPGSALGHIWTHRQDDDAGPRLPLRSGGVCSPTTNLVWVHVYNVYLAQGYMIYDTVRIANLMKINNLQTKIEHDFH